MPLWMIHRLIQKINDEGAPFIAYFHPYEFYDLQLDSFQAFQPNNYKQRLQGLRYNFHQNLGRSTVYKKLEMLLKSFNFTTCQKFLNDNNLPENNRIKLSETEILWG